MTDVGDRIRPRAGLSARAGSVGEERELSILPVGDRAKMASRREIAVAYWGPDEVERRWDPDGWMRARLDVARGIERGRRADGDPAADGE